MTQFIVGFVCLIIAIVILIGKGDWLIAGYNTASKEEKEKVNIKRLRLIVGILFLLIAPGCFLPIDDSDKTHNLLFAGVVVVLTTVAVILANTWAKKK